MGAHIRSISDLEPLVEYVRDELCIAEPTVGIENVQQHVCPEKELTALDYQIIRSLQKNSRKQIVDIAEELHISAKTVQRKLSNMENNRMIKFSLEWYPDKKDDIMTIFHIQLRPFSDKEEVGRRLMEKYFPNLMFLVSFSNLSQFLLAFVWSKSMKELQNLHSMFEADGAFDSVMFNILYKGLILPTWSDKFVLEKSTPPKKACK